jgi:hypothetical protein
VAGRCGALRPRTGAPQRGSIACHDFLGSRTLSRRGYGRAVSFEVASNYILKLYDEAWFRGFLSDEDLACLNSGVLLGGRITVTLWSPAPN